MQRADILKLLREILTRQGKPAEFGEDANLRTVGFRSLDFSELALRVEAAAGVTLTFDAAPLRAISTVKDVLDFLQTASGKQ
jgi:acyl carrier protein